MNTYILPAVLSGERQTLKLINDLCELLGDKSTVINAAEVIETDNPVISAFCEQLSYSATVAPVEHAIRKNGRRAAKVPAVDPVTPKKRIGRPPKSGSAGIPAKNGHTYEMADGTIDSKELGRRVLHGDIPVGEIVTRNDGREFVVVQDNGTYKLEARHE